MVVVSQPAVLDDISLIKTCKTSNIMNFTGIPVIDLKDPEAKTQVVKACEEFGFFKVVNHGVPMELVSKLEVEAINFFNMTQSEKHKAAAGGAAATPFGYGCKNIGPNGDMGWIEYLLFSTNPQLMTSSHSSFLHNLTSTNPEIFRMLLNEYVGAVRDMGCQVLELMADGLKIGERNVWSRLLKDEKSDSCFRLNYYPPCPQLQALKGRSLIGFGEHTDPQVISIGRCNNTTGLQICLKDGSWVSVPPDHTSFFITVDDCLQVITNGRFKSVKHRVLADSLKSRLSMIYFGGPTLGGKIAPLASLMEKGEESLYNEFTWGEYKKSVYKTRLGDHRLGFFEKSISGKDSAYSQV